MGTVNVVPTINGGRWGGRFLGASAFDCVWRGVVLITVVMLQRGSGEINAVGRDCFFSSELRTAEIRDHDINEKHGATGALLGGV